MKRIKSLAEYQRATDKLSQFKKFGITLPPLVYFTLGLVGEAGELSEKVKKLYRDNKGKLGIETRELLKLELGDVLWYISQVATSVGSSLEEVAQLNIKKLESRLERDKIHGSGDRR